MWSQKLNNQCLDLDWLIVGNPVDLALHACRSTSARASPTRPLDATPMCSSILKIFSMDEASGELEVRRACQRSGRRRRLP